MEAGAPAAVLIEALLALQGIHADPRVVWEPGPVAMRVAELVHAASDAGLSSAALAELRAEGAKIITAAVPPPPPLPLRKGYASFGGRELQRAPVVYQFDAFFTAEEAHHIISLARPRLQASTGMAEHGTVTKVFGGRTSQTAGVEPWEDGIVANLTARVAGVVGLSVENLEVLSVTRYTGHQEYKPHRDSFGWRSRQDRFVTALLYLNDVPRDSGGGTRFPHLRDGSTGAPLEVSPATGGMVVFHNLKERTLETEPLTLHAGLPMTGGPSGGDRSVASEPDSKQEKWIANCWFRGENWEEPSNYWPAHWLGPLPCSPGCGDDEIPTWKGNETAHGLAKAEQDRVGWKKAWRPKVRVNPPPPPPSPTRQPDGGGSGGSLTMTSSEL